MKQAIIWIGALIVGAVLGLLGLGWLNDVMDFVATVYTRLFQLLAVPTIVLAVTTTFATFGSKGSGRILGRTLIYTLLTTFAAAAVGALLYVVVAPGNLPVLDQGDRLLDSSLNHEPVPSIQTSYYDHILSIIPNNIVKPFLEGNVLSLLLLAFAVGIGLSKLPESENKSVVVKGLLGLQDLLFLLIRGLIWALPLGIVAFSAQLSAQVSAGVVADSIGKYVLVVLGGNVIQFFVILPLFLIARGLNPIHVLGKMMPAVIMALFTKSLDEKKEMRVIDTQTIPLSESARKAQINTYKSRKHTTITVEKGTTLTKLAKQYYDNMYCWVYLYMANIDRIENPNALIEGSVLEIPELTKEELAITKEESLVLYGMSHQFK